MSNTPGFSVDMARSLGRPACRALLKASNLDFVVREELGFAPDGEGEHLFIYIEKQGLTTPVLARDVARQLGVPVRHIGYSGLKDKHAVTSQWLSVPWPIKKAVPELQGESWHVLELTRHVRKLRRGVHKANHFSIRLQQLEGDTSAVLQRLETISRLGFPNYFGEQRFGAEGANLARLDDFFSGKLKLDRQQKSMHLSAARSYLFNRYLEERVLAGSWNMPLEGDVFLLDGSHSWFVEKGITDDIIRRVNEWDIHPAGPMPGAAIDAQHAEAADLRARAWQGLDNIIDGLAKSGTKTDWRALRVQPKALNWTLGKNSLEICFTLPTGSFATSLIAELVEYQQP